MHHCPLKGWKMIDNRVKTNLLKLARGTIESKFIGLSPDLELYTDDIYNEKRGAFVTLHKEGQLRGCIGYIIAYKSLKETISEMALAAAFRDPRFEPLRREELSQIDIEISVLSEMIPIENASEIVIGRDGLLIEHFYGHGVLLPQVATEYGWDVKTYLKQLCFKAGLSAEAWKDKEARLFRFTAEVFGEKD